MMFLLPTVKQPCGIQTRNREMVDRADIIICYIEENHGGAFQTIQYAERIEKPIINLANIGFAQKHQ